jgi:hypothetical protein
MIKSKCLYIYLCAQTLFLLILIFWYVFGDLYFGFELGDLIIVFIVILMSLVSCVLLLFNKKINFVVLSIFTSISVVFDIAIVWLIIRQIVS